MIGARCHSDSLRQLRHRRVGAHPAGVRAAIAVEDALVVVRRRQRVCALPIAQRHQRDLPADQAFFDDRARADVVRWVGRVGVGGVANQKATLDEDLSQGRFGLLGRLGHRHTLASRQAVGLHHHPRIGQLRHRRHTLLERARVAPARGRHARLLHQLLGERLGALQARRRGRWAEGQVATSVERVHEARHQRRLGPHHGEVGALTLHRRDDSLDVVGRHVDQARVPCDAGVAGSAHQLRNFLGARERTHQRVLAPTRADDEHPHVRGKR